MDITFLGAARTVTGSCHLVTGKNFRVLVDCGVFQGRPEVEDRNWQDFEFDPREIDYVFLTHAHLDHCGMLPKLVKHGFRGEIISTDATKDLTEIILNDACKIMHEDYERGHLRDSNGNLMEPLYDEEDVKETMKLFHVYDYTKHYLLPNGIEFRMRNAGHILGSSIFELWLTNDDGRKRKLVFSGDLGQPGERIIWDPDIIREADYLVTESTYGDRLHKEKDLTVLEFLSILQYAERGSTILIPVFAIERAQEIIYELNLIVEQGLLHKVKAILDSPLADKATQIFMRYKKYYDTDANLLLERGDDPFEFKGFSITKSVEESKRLAGCRRCIIMAGSGMCTGGRILHHLIQHATNPNNHIMFVGFQAQGTLGRRIVDGAKKVKIFGKSYEIKAKVHTLGGFSAHADQRDLLYWIHGFGRTPRKVFLVHGEDKSLEELAKKIKSECHLDTYIPEWKERVHID